MRRRLAFVLACTALAGCSLEPHYTRPEPAIPPSWPAGDAYLRASEAALPSVSYRDIFGDSRLQAIIERALANNQDVRVSVANVEAARASYRVQRSALFPNVDASGGFTTSHTGGNAANTGAVGGIGNGIGNVGGGTGHRTIYRAQLGLSAFEIDLFGRQRSLTRAQFQEFLGTEAGLRAARLALVGEVASAYLTLAADRSLLAIAADTEKSAARSVELTRARLTGGVAPRSDLRQAETVLDRARSDHADRTTAVAQDRNALELLVGGPVADTELPESIESVDGLLGEVPAGLDSRILLRRPDVVQAEYALRAANARIGAARANFFPTISLTAAIGFVSSGLSSLFDGDSFNWSVGPSATRTVFDAGANAGNLALARANQAGALAQYQGAIQTAFREVADALARRGTIDRQLAADRDLEAAARDTFMLAEARYREGIDPFLNTLDAQRTLYDARRTLVATRLTRADNLVTLYRVLGGDQVVESMPPPKALSTSAP